jgi:hypothetical protein
VSRSPLPGNVAVVKASAAHPPYFTPKCRSVAPQVGQVLRPVFDLPSVGFERTDPAPIAGRVSARDFLAPSLAAWPRKELCGFASQREIIRFRLAWIFRSKVSPRKSDPTPEKKLLLRAPHHLRRCSRLRGCSTRFATSDEHFFYINSEIYEPRVPSKGVRSCHSFLSRFAGSALGFSSAGAPGGFRPSLAPQLRLSRSSWPPIKRR